MTWLKCWLDYVKSWAQTPEGLTAFTLILITAVVTAIVTVLVTHSILAIGRLLRRIILFILKPFISSIRWWKMFRQWIGWRKYKPECRIKSFGKLIIQHVDGINPYNGMIEFAIEYTNKHERKITLVDCTNIRLRIHTGLREGPLQFTASGDVKDIALTTEGENKTKVVSYKALKYFQAYPLLKSTAKCEIISAGSASIAGLGRTNLRIPEFPVQVIKPERL